jgi:ABC-2 type transport system ATP-binding protein
MKWLLRAPRLLLLDEPTTGLDPAGMRDMRELIRRLAREGLTVLLSSHLLAEVEELCNRVAIIRRGRIVYEGSLGELKQRAGTSWRLRATEPERARLIAIAQGVGEPSLDAGELRFAAEEPRVAALTVALGQAGIGITALQTRREPRGAPPRVDGAERTRGVGRVSALGHAETVALRPPARGGAARLRGTAGSTAGSS